MNKRVLAAILAICMAFAILPTAAFAEEEGGITVGSCGKEVNWALSEDGTLTVSGSGEMYDYENPEWAGNADGLAPWHGIRESIARIVVEAGVTKIGDYAFSGCALNEALVPASVTVVGEGAFSGNGGLILVGAKGSAIEIYAGQNGLAFVEHTHEWNDGDKSNLSCANKMVPYTCYACGAVEEREVEAAHELSKVERMEATCDAEGITEHYKCTVCGKLFRDEKGTMAITQADTVIKKRYHDFELVERKAATCVEEGYARHFKCKSCGKLFKDWPGKEEITLESIRIEKEKHRLVRVYAENADCVSDGCKEHYKCLVCGALFLDKDASEEAVAEDLVVGALGHTLWRVEAVEATCTDAGSIEYFYCDACGKKFRDASGTEPVGKVKVKALGHQYVRRTVKATPKSKGGVTDVCKRCGREVKIKTYYKIDDIYLWDDIFYYNGKNRTPKVIVRDSRGKKIAASNYWVIYEGDKQKAVGKYKVTVQFMSKAYAGKKVLYYKILPADVKMEPAYSDADGQLTVRWKPGRGIDGYQIRYSSKRSMKGSKNVFVKGAKKKQHTIKKLQKGRKYYVQVRGYKKIGRAKTYYGEWGKQKSAKTLNMKLNYKSLSLETGQAKTLKLVGAKRPVKWKTSNPAVASVDSAGKVTGTGDGTATVTAICAGSSYSCKVTVKTLSKFDKLYNHINAYGSVNKFGNRHVNASYILDSSTWDIAIVYDRNGGEFEFICFSPFREAVTMSIGRNGSATAKCQYVCSNYYEGCNAFADFNVPSYSVNSDLHFTFQICYGSNQEEFKIIAEMELAIGMKLWDYYLKEHLGFGMSDLGFISYY